MAYLKKSDVMAAIKSREQQLNGVAYTIYEAYLGTSPITKKPIRKYAKSLEKLRHSINEFYAQLSSSGDAGAMLNAYQAMDALNAINLLAEVKLKLSLSDCVRRIIETGKQKPACAITIGEAYAQYEKQQADKSDEQRKTVRCRVGAWVARFGGQRLLSEVTAKEVADDLNKTFYRHGSEKSKTTYNGHLGYIKTFLNWCANPTQGYLEQNPVKAIDNKTKAYEDPEYMMSADVEKMFRVLERRGSIYLAHAILSFFCGMRQSEISRSPMGDEAIVIDLKEQYIRIVKVKGASRGIKPRAFTIPPQALAWMRSMPNFEKAVREPSNKKFREELVSAAKEAGVYLPENAGRHTFCTMFEAAYHDSNALSAIVGNSEDVRSHHYNGVAKPPEGRAYFAILPSGGSR